MMGMYKRFSVKNEVSSHVTDYLNERPKPFNDEYMRKGVLIAEVKYYFEEHEKAGFPIAVGIHELELDHASVIAVDNRPYVCHVIGIWDKAVTREQKKAKRT
jgi:hypothetical protein